MTTLDTILMYGLPLGLCAMFLAMPKLSRGNTFFAVTVPRDLPDSAEGRSIHRRYLAGTLTATLIALGLITAAHLLFAGEFVVDAAYLLGTFTVTFGALISFLHCRQQALAFSRAPSMERRGSLSPSETLGDVLPKPFWLHALPYLILALPCLWLLMHWEQIPEPMLLPGQFEPGSSEQAKTLSALLLFPLVMTLVLLLMHLVMPLGLLIRRLPQHPARVQTINRLLLNMMLVVAALGGWNTLAVLYGPEWITGLVGLTVNGVLTMLLVVLPVLMLMGKHYARPGQPDEGDQTPDHCWKLGMFYFNPEDQALWVEKRFGVGYTLNFAHAMAWIILAAFIAIPAVIVFLSFR